MKFVEIEVEDTVFNDRIIDVEKIIYLCPSERNLFINGVSYPIRITKDSVEKLIKIMKDES